MKVSSQPISKLNSVIASDGRSVRFTVVVRSGQSLAFSVPYQDMGVLIQRLQKTAAAMRDRLYGTDGRKADAAIVEALSQPATVSGLAAAKDARTGEMLLWIETEECGSLPLRLSGQALATLRQTLHEHEEMAAPAAGVARHGRRTGAGRPGTASPMPNDLPS